MPTVLGSIPTATISFSPAIDLISLWEKDETQRVAAEIEPGAFDVLGEKPRTFDMKGEKKKGWKM